MPARRTRREKFPSPQHIRRLREEADLSQAELGAACGCARSTVVLAEGGLCSPAALKIAAYLEQLAAERRDAS